MDSIAFIKHDSIGMVKAPLVLFSYAPLRKIVQRSAVFLFVGYPKIF